jgi:hypothetical protein
LVDDLAQQPAELRACAIKLGQPADPSVSALQAATTEHQGYLLAAGLLADPGGTRLTQDTLQAVASLQGAQVALTQSGSMLSGSERRIPFQLSEADLAVEVVLIAPADAQLRFALQTPNGFVIEPAVASARSMQYAAHGGMRFYRFVLPTEIEPARFDQEGTWHALIRYGKLPPSSGPAAGAGPLAQAANPLIGRIRGVSVRSPSGSQPAPFSSPVSFRLLVHTYSRSSLRAHLVQSSDAPGANVELFARLSECEVFELASASVWAEVRGPDGLRFNVELNERTQLGEQRGAFVASRAGVYRIRVRGRAVSRRGHTFQRELTLSAQVWSAGAGTANNAPLV